MTFYEKGKGGVHQKVIFGDRYMPINPVYCILCNITIWAYVRCQDQDQDRSLYLTLRGTMPQIKNKRLVKEGNSQDYHS